MKPLYPISIIHFITDLSIGGAQRMLCNILPHFDRRKFEPVVVCLFGGDSLIAEGMKNSGIKVIDLQMKNKLDIYAIWRFYNLLRKEKPIILHSSLFHASIIARVVGKLVKVPIIITWRHNIDHGNDIREWINKVTSSWDDCVIAVSNAVKESEIKSTGVNSEKVVVINNCIDTRIYARINGFEKKRIKNDLGIPEKAFLIGSIGRLHTKKGFNVLLQSFKKIKESIPNSWLIIVGEGELRESLEEIAQDLEISEFTIFTGILNNIPEILGIIDVFVMSSHSEGMPLVILEAMASQLPVVATSVGGIPEVISNNQTGLLIPPNDPGSIVDRVIQIYNDNNLSKSLGKAGQERIKFSFDVIPITNQIENLYSDLLSKKELKW